MLPVLTGIGGLNPMSAMGQMAGELGVDQRVFGIFNQNDFGVFDSAAGMSSEYAMQTALEFVPIPILIMKLVPIDPQKCTVQLWVIGQSIFSPTPSVWTVGQSL